MEMQRKDRDAIRAQVRSSPSEACQSQGPVTPMASGSTPPRPHVWNPSWNQLHDHMGPEWLIKEERDG